MTNSTAHHVQPALDFFSSALEKSLFEAESNSRIERLHEQRLKRQSLSSKKLDDLLRSVDLDQPLFRSPQTQEVELDDFVQPQPKPKPRRRRSRKEETGEVYEWTDDDILRIKSGLLTRSLDALGSYGNSEEKKEILQWMNEDDVVGQYLGRLVFIEEVEPFSFRACCKLEGLCPDTLREAIFNQLASRQDLSYLIQ